MTKILWTGGWDSTFRLLQLVLTEKREVQPVYVKDIDRKSYRKELETIDLILDKIEKHHPEAIKNIKPLIVIDKNQIVIDPDLKECYDKICDVKKIGSQYLWLASFCKQNEIDSIELSIEKDNRTDSFFNFISPFFKENLPNPNSLLKEEVIRIFNYFNFNLFEVTKVDILNISKENGWMEIMDSTWFCHKPKNNKPCGKCKPCLTAFTEGLKFRIPAKRRIYAYIKLFKNRIKSGN
ncbi:7-cyano-7-deazaguanine synthase [Flavobacterium sp. H122]|uniref:7-cyano-7-deazaguanine synthase n=1 Tax=Flavobacterium sp. H122 TaxID=2529860 RepID=UPI0010AA4C4F|nr:7-cyano-7-deazaguanine synthase [Flavobacterium sp. H122]